MQQSDEQYSEYEQGYNEDLHDKTAEYGTHQEHSEHATADRFNTLENSNANEHKEDASDNYDAGGQIQWPTVGTSNSEWQPSRKPRRHRRSNSGSGSGTSHHRTFYSSSTSSVNSKSKKLGARRKRDYIGMAKAFIIEAPYLVNGSDYKWCPPSLRRENRRSSPRRRLRKKPTKPTASTNTLSIDQLQAMDNAMRLDEVCFRCHKQAEESFSSTSSMGKNAALEDPRRIEHVFLPCHHACLCKGCLAEAELLESSSRLRSDTPKGKFAKEKKKENESGHYSSKDSNTHQTQTPKPQQFESRRLPKGITCPLCNKPAKHLIHIKDVFALTARKFRRYRRLPDGFTAKFASTGRILEQRVVKL